MMAVTTPLLVDELVITNDHRLGRVKEVVGMDGLNYLVRMDDNGEQELHGVSFLTRMWEPPRTPSVLEYPDALAQPAMMYQYAMPQDSPTAWPDLPEAAYSDVGALALRWLKNGDWSAVGPLLDALADAERMDDVKALRACVAQAGCRLFSHADVCGRGGPDGFYGGYYTAVLADSWRHHATRLLWFDLFDFAGTVAVLAKRESKG